MVADSNICTSFYVWEDEGECPRPPEEVRDEVPAMVYFTRSSFSKYQYI